MADIFRNKFHKRKTFVKKSEMHLLAQALLCYFSDFLTKASNTAKILYIENLPQNFTFCGKSYFI